MRIDDAVTALAARQYGLASTHQIRELGGDDQLIRDAARDAAMVAAGWRKPVRVYEEDIW
jgi:hypothetical protein